MNLDTIPMVLRDGVYVMDLTQDQKNNERSPIIDYFTRFDPILKSIREESNRRRYCAL